VPRTRARRPWPATTPRGDADAKAGDERARFRLLARIEQLVGRPVMPWELEEPDMLMRRAQRPRRQDGYWDDW